MQSHKVIGAGVTHTVGPTSGKEYLRIMSITVMGTNGLTVTVTNADEGGYSFVMNSTRGHYPGPFQFRPRDSIAFVVGAATTVLFEGYSLQG